MIGCSGLPTNGISITELTKDELDYERFIPKEILKTYFSCPDCRKIYLDSLEQDIINSYGVDSLNEWKKWYYEYYGNKEYELDYKIIISKEILENEFGYLDSFGQEIINSHGLDSFNKWKREYYEYKKRRLENIWNDEVNKDSLDSIPTYTYSYNEKPYNGIAYKRDSPGGFILNIWFFIRSGGKIMNVYRFEGWEEYTFKNGKKHGPWVYNGQEDGDFYLLKSGVYKNGLKDGVEKRWNNDGKLIKEDYYKDGKLILK